jgi:2-phospho-L-lactate transferase/gluconeogenesis factor (CofD/UPF0052 family)
MTEPGETDDLTLEDHLEAIHRHVGVDLFDYVLVNRQQPTAEILARYTAAGSKPVARRSTSPWIGSTRIVERDLAWDASHDKVRHAPDDLAAAIIDLVSAGRPHTARVHRLSRHVTRTRAR